jgi:hypothetical protein
MAENEETGNKSDGGTYLPQEFVTEWTVNPKGITKVIGDIANQAAMAMNIFDEKPFKYLDEQATSIQNAFGLTKDRMSEFKQIVADVGPELVKMGLTMEDAAKTTTELMKGMKSSGTIAKETMVELAAVSKLTDVSVGTLASNFRDVGISIYDVGDEMKNVVNLAKQAGASVSAVAGLVTSNLKQLNLFNFSNGVEGITKMAIQSERLGVSMEKTMAKAEELLSPEKAIEMSSALQRLGVTSSELLDPLRAMDLAQNDPAELQNQIVELSKQFTQFNAETGKMEIMPGAKRRLREVAGELGLNADEFANMSIKAADFDRKMSQLKLPDFASDSKETKELIASMAQMKDGVATINIKDQKTGEVVLKQVDQLTPEDIEKLKTSQEEQGKSVEQLAVEQLDQLKGINAGINGVRTASALGRATSAPMERLYESMMGVQTTISRDYAARTKTEGVRTDVSSLTQKMEDYVVSGLKGDDKAQIRAKDEFGANLVALEEKVMANQQKYFEETIKNIGENFKKAYETPKETKSKVDMSINSTFKVEGNENTQNLTEANWDTIWNQKLNDPTWLNTFKDIFGGANLPSAEVGPKKP